MHNKRIAFRNVVDFGKIITNPSSSFVSVRKIVTGYTAFSC